MKKYVVVLVAVTMIINMFTYSEVSAMGIMPISEPVSDGYELIINGETIVFSEYAPMPYSESEVTMLPLRSILENIGFLVGWDNETKQVTMEKGDLFTSLNLNNNKYVTFDNNTINLEIAPTLKASRTYVPISFFVDVLGMDVVEDGMTISLEGHYDDIVNVDDDNIIPIVVDVPTDYMEDNFYEYSMSVVESLVNADAKAIRLTGNNHSDDMFTGFAKKIDGLKADTEYIFKIRFDIGTNVPKNMMGIGGSPGSSVYVKAGISTEKPNTHILDEYIRFDNIDKGNQSQSGSDMRQVGNIEKESDDYSEVFENKGFAEYFIAKTNEHGEAHLLLGIDSGFEGLTEIYFENIALNIREANDYSLSLLKETNFQLNSMSYEHHNDVFINIPKASGMIQKENEDKLNQILDDTVDTLLDGRDISSFYFAHTLKNQRLLSIVFTGREVVEEQTEVFYKVLNIDMSNLEIIDTIDLLKADDNNTGEFLALMNEKALEKGFSNTLSFDDIEIFYETGIYGIILEDQGEARMLFIDELECEPFMKF